MHITTESLKSTFFRQRLNAASDIKFTVGGSKFETLITRS